MLDAATDHNQFPGCATLPPDVSRKPDPGDGAPWNPSTFWTEERVALLKHLWVQEWRSAGFIAQVLGEGCTRSMVIGKVARLKLKKGGTWAEPRPKPPRAEKRNAKKSKPKRKAFRLAPDGLKYDPTPIVDWPPLPGATPMSFMDLPLRGRCKMPVIGGFCGCPCGPGQSFCPEHRAIVYRPAAGLSAEDGLDSSREA